MERFRDYKITFKSEVRLNIFLEQLKSKLKNGVGFTLGDNNGDNNLIVAYCNLKAFPKSRIILYKDNLLVYIANIVPFKESGVDQLSHYQYNGILDAFVSQIISNIILSEDSVYTNKGTYSIDEIIPKSYAKLNSWLNGFPKSTHPMDENRWYDLVISLYDNDEIISIDTLEDFLEELGWTNDEISKILLRYEDEISLLRHVGSRLY
jgi:hypothetical protein